jgi:amidase
MAFGERRDQTSVIPEDPVGALVPHTLREPVAGGGEGPLAGLTFMVKDMFAIAGRKVSNGNPDFYADSIPAEETAPVILRLLDAGASLTGITICDEFFYSMLGTNAHYGTPRNIRAPEHVTGGSSCGSAAAVAAGMCDFALGSDTGGSIRVPASFCGLYGFRPTHGRIDTAGATPMAPRYDTVGFLARDAELFRRIGKVLLQGDFVETEIDRVIIAEDLFARAEVSIAEALWTLLRDLESELPSITLKDVAGEALDDWRHAFRIIQAFEIQSTLLPFIETHDARLWPGIKERFGAAANVTQEEFETARAERTEIAQLLYTLIQPGTLIALPTTPTLPPERGIPDGAPTAEFRTLTMQNTCVAGHAGLPQISIPAGEASGCPTGLSFIGWHGGDANLLDLAVQLARMPLKQIQE